MNPSHLSTEHHGFRIVRVPVGPSAGTQERLVLVQEGELRGFDLGIKAVARINLKGSRAPSPKLRDKARGTEEESRLPGTMALGPE